MRIALVGPLFWPIAPSGSAGTEIWTYNFLQKLLKKGVEATLFATTGSKSSGKIVNVCRQSDIAYDNGEPSRSKYQMFTIKEMVEVYKRQNDFDLIHLSIYGFMKILPFVELINKPILLTVHETGYRLSEIKTAFKLYPSVYYVFLANHMTKHWPRPYHHRVIYNGIEIDDFPLADSKRENYYFWIGRLNKEKGVEDAILFAEKTGSELVIAGLVRDRGYFERDIKPHLSKKIKFVGQLGFREKVKHYQRARALLMPIKWEEPFGLVVTEAMACGTPVIAYDRGAMPEIISDGVDGFLVKPDDITGLVEAAKKIDSIDHQTCRRKVEDKFNLDRMVDDYLRYYGEIIKEQKSKQCPRIPA